MALITIYNLDGKEAGTMDVSDKLFAAKGSIAAVHQALTAHLANTRLSVAHTKDRGDVRGGGKKPWKQKGTGRARHGSSRSPIWKGGGVTFGPRAEKNFSVKINKSMKRKALALVLSDKVKSTKFIAVSSFDLPEAKSKFVSELRAKLPGAKSSAVILTLPSDKTIIRAAKNVPKTSTMFAGSLNVSDLMARDYVLASKAAIEFMTKTYSA